ncbi:hypothetical protein ACKWTF_010239 [Chironomus riparius]
MGTDFEPINGQSDNSDSSDSFFSRAHSQQHTTKKNKDRKIPMAELKRKQEQKNLLKAAPKTIPSKDKVKLADVMQDIESDTRKQIFKLLKYSTIVEISAINNKTRTAYSAISLTRPLKNLQLIEPDGLLDIKKMLLAAEEVARDVKEPVKIGSVFGTLIYDESTRGMNINLPETYQHITFSNILAIYYYRDKTSCKYERVPIFAQKSLNGSSNYSPDPGYVDLNPGIRILYASRAINKADPNSPPFIEMTNNDYTSNVTDLIVTHYLLEFAGISSYICPRCDSVVIGIKTTNNCSLNHKVLKKLRLNGFEKWPEPIVNKVNEVLTKLGMSLSEFKNSISPTINRLAKDYKSMFRVSRNVIKFNVTKSFYAIKDDSFLRDTESSDQVIDPADVKMKMFKLEFTKLS